MSNSAYIGDSRLLEYMHDMRATMIYVSQQLMLRGEEAHADQLSGAAGIVATWIAGMVASPFGAQTGDKP